MNIPAIALNPIVAIQHVPTWNSLAIAHSSGVLFGVKPRETQGLRFTVYGGNFPIQGEPTWLDDQTVILTASDTNYVYHDTEGVVFCTTVTPTDWPGPMPSGASALYELVTDANEVTGWTNYHVGKSAVGPDGPQGAVGEAGDDIYLHRRRITTTAGDGSTNLDSVGFVVSASGSGIAGRTLGVSSLAESIPYIAKPHANGLGSVCSLYSQNFCSLERGFDVLFRWCYESAASIANQRRLVALIDTSIGAIGNVEANTLVNLIGVGSLVGDANLSLINNDASGTATMSTLGANFPAKTTSNVYELRLTCVAGSGVVTYNLTDMGTGNTTGDLTVSSDLPASGQYLGWCLWSGNGIASGTGTTTIGFMQVESSERY